MFFDYMLFLSLSPEEFANRLTGKGYSEEGIRKSYPYWLKNFHRSAIAFYDAQYKRHEELARVEFAKLHGTASGNYELEDEWQEFREMLGLNAHNRDKENIENNLNFNLRDYAPKAWTEFSKPRLRPISEIVSDAIIEETLPVSLHIFNETWFNAVINNPLHVQTQLKKLPYSPDYLKTSHWRRARSALILIRDAVCQEISCDALHESWYGDEENLHVHHLTYKNRGNERYQDLRLLCSTHHKQLHEQMKQGNVTLEIIEHEEAPLFSLIFNKPKL